VQTAAIDVANDAESGSAEDSGFVAVPYAPPLAAGEFVSVVRAQLEPAALARLGILVDSAYGSEIPADIVVGEDGVPRAVRVIEMAEF
jgi:hypothetical protein